MTNPCNASMHKRHRTCFSLFEGHYDKIMAIFKEGIDLQSTQ